MKVVRLNYQEFDQYISKTEYNHYFQTSYYANLISKFGLKAEYYGFEEASNLIGATLILSKPVFMSFKYGYAPRGIILNFNDEPLVSQAVKELKNKLLKEHFLVLKMDPLIIKTKYDKKGKIIDKSQDADRIISILKYSGFSHGGFNNKFEKVNPRWEAELDLKEETATLFKNLDKQIRNKLRKATKYGLTVYKDNNYDIDTIYPLIKNKEKVPEKYYHNMHTFFGDKLEIYCAKLNTKIYVQNSKHLYEKEMEINDYLTNIIQSNGYKGKNMNYVLNKKMESDKLLSAYKKYMVQATELLKVHPDGIVVGTSLIVKNKNKIFLVVEGYNDEFKNLNSTFLTKWKIIEKYANSEYEYFNMSALANPLNKDDKEFSGLNEMKLGYNSYALEYIGEFELIINNTMYKLYKGMVSK